MSQTITEFTTLRTQHCYACDVLFATTVQFDDIARERGRSFYCPNGHGQSYTETENMRLKKELESKSRELVEQKCETLRQKQAREAAEQSAIALEKSKQRLAKRIQNGVCPCCNRTFTNLARHMKTKHPEKA